MEADYKAEFKALIAETGSLRDANGDVMAAFANLHKATMQEGALSVKTKELIALALGIGRQCEGCLQSHARGAARSGATREEVAETIGVAIMMGGGPGTVYGAKALAAFDQFAGSV